MSRRGEIVIECDLDFCQAELVLPADAFMNRFINTLLSDQDWERRGDRDICPQCIEEGKL